MREILFRGQTRRKGERIINMAGDKCDSNWVYGGIFPQNEEEKGFAVIYQQEPEIKKYSVYADTVCQYTEVDDKNGKNIFHKDIVSAPFTGYVGKKHTRIGVVEYVKGAFCVNWNDSEEYGKNFLGYVNDIEVIGNVFDNPELLKEDAENA